MPKLCEQMRQIGAIALILLMLVLPILFFPMKALAAPAQATVEWLISDSPGQDIPDQDIPGQDIPDQDIPDQDYQRAERPIPLEFPKDFGAHPGYQTEWWYYTGNLETGEGREFGYQFTIFRRAIKPNAQLATATDWRSNQIYFAHFTVSDIANQDFYPQERFSRGAAHLAGAEADPYQVWIENWSIVKDENQVHLQAKGDKVAIDLMLDQTRPPVLQGDRGYSAKGPEPGNASYYYSIVQQPTSGTVQIGSEIVQVTGRSWKDHEYSTSALSPGTAGWDWFSLQFEDDTALMLYVLRQENGMPLKFSKGNFIDQHGEMTALEAEDWQLHVVKHWMSPGSGAKYPSEWSLRIPKLDLSLQGRPLMPNQELNLETVYWEGAVQFSGTRKNQPTRAKGYAELTGYKEALTTLRSNSY